MSTSAHPADPVPELIDRRRRSVAGFLADRDLDPEQLSGFMLGRVGPGELLLTSSPVQGLANPTSDLDFIRIQEAGITGPRIATKIFEGGHHLEVVSFSSVELKRNLDELAALAERPTAEVVAGYRGWDKRFEPRRKQTERIVNGLTLDGRAPHLHLLPALGLVWSRASLQVAAEQTAHLCLAEAAGERRGRVGYAYNALLHLMDAVLSMHGEVYTTRKWFLLRWSRFVERGRFHDEGYRALAADLEQARVAVSPALAPGHAEALAPVFADLVVRTAAATGAADALTAAVLAAEDARHLPFLPGAGMVLAGGSALTVTGDWPPDPQPVGLAELAGLSPAAASTALRAVRAGAAAVRIDWSGGRPGLAALVGEDGVSGSVRVDPATDGSRRTAVAAEVPIYPGLRAGHGRADAAAVASWLQVAWLMLAEGRAYLEDLEGGAEQPQMQQAARLRLLEQLVDIDNRMAGRTPVPDAHCLAVGLEHGTHELVDATGPQLAEIFGLDQEFGGPTCAIDGITVLWQRLLDGFPGELPDRLVAQGHRDMLRTLQDWAALARSTGQDVGLLTPFMKDA